MSRRRIAVASLAAVAAASAIALVASRDSRPLEPAEVAARARGTARMTLEVDIEIAGRTPLRTVMTGIADLDRHACDVRVELDANDDVFELDAYNLVTTPQAVYVRGTGPWVTFRPDRDAVPTTDPLLPIVSLARATGWERVADRSYRGRDDVLNAALEVEVDGEGRPVEVRSVTPTGPGTTRTRLRLEAYGTPVDVSTPPDAERVADIDAAFEAVGLT